jgi:hypothetical protein
MSTAANVILVFLVMIRLRVDTRHSRAPVATYKEYKEAFPSQLSVFDTPRATGRRHQNVQPSLATARRSW